MAQSFNKMDYWIPEYIHDPKHIKRSSTPCESPSCPIIVFINTKSGGQLGGALLQSYRHVLNRYQVYDLHTEPPQDVLKRIYGNLERLKEEDDELAKKVSENLRLIVAGGDGTASWMLGVVCDLKLPKPPPIATVPLGTGNNLPFSFGWGKKNPDIDSCAVETFLRQVMEAKEMKIDNWHIIMRMKAPEALCWPNSLELPNSLHEFKRVPSTESMNKEVERTYRGGFWNYFSVGMDAEVSYEFHSERKKHPEKFKSQILNQRTYLKLGFSATLLQGSSRCIKELTTIEVMKKPTDNWTSIDIPRGIKSVICLNLPSFSGGYNPWGIPTQRCGKDFTQVFVDDELIEVVGFHNAFHGLFLLSHKGHGTRLAQAHKVRFTFSKHPTGDTYMRMDGEPWIQPLPKNGTVELVISHHGQVKMLARDKCISKSKGSIETSTPSTSIDDDESKDYKTEEARKFGAAETFKLPEHIDIASLS